MFIGLLLIPALAVQTISILGKVVLIPTLRAYEKITSENDALAKPLLRRDLTDDSGWQQQREGQSHTCSISSPSQYFFLAAVDNT